MQVQVKILTLDTNENCHHSIKGNILERISFQQDHFTDLDRCCMMHFLLSSSIKDDDSLTLWSMDDDPLNAQKI